jgi:DNA polymerase-3 subunit chi
MGDSDDISASAASIGGGSSTPASSAADGLRVDFYVMEEAAPAARLKVACRLAEKAYLASDRAELAALDDLLWTFADGSFVPHEWLTSNAAAAAPVLLSAGPAPAEAFDFVVNLAAEPPPFLHLTRRIAEIIDGDAGRRRAGRARFQAYRELGIVPATTRL